MDYYRKYLEYLIEGGIKPIKPNIEMAYELIPDAKANNNYNINNNENEPTIDDSRLIQSKKNLMIKTDSFIKINKNGIIYPKIKPIVGTKNEYRFSQSLSRFNNLDLGYNNNHDFYLTTSNFNNLNNLNNQINSNNNFQHPVVNNISYQMKYTSNNQNNNFSPSSVGGIISNDLEKGVQERNLILDKYEELFKEGYNKLTNLKNENSALKQNLSKLKKDNPKLNEENEEEENENDNEINEIQTVLKNKNVQNIPQNDVNIDWVELKNLNDEINNLRKENLKNQQKYEIKLNQLKNKIDQLEIRIESQNH
jgi:hypothetical protein